jgi:hypothetical protein
MTYKHLVNTFWEDTRLLGNPARSWGFSYPIAEENGEHVSLTSEDGIPWLCYEDGFYDEVRVVVPD